MFQSDLRAGNGVAELTLPNSGGFVAPDWRGLLRRTVPQDILGIGLGTEGVTDLGADIGSKRWWLGMAACTALCGTALWLGSMVVPLSEAPRAVLTPVQREALRPSMVAPLARGGATGAEVLPQSRLVEALAETPERPRLELTAQMRAQDSFESVLRRAGVGQGDIAAVTVLVRPAANLGALTKGSDIDIVLGRRDSKSVPRPLESLGFRAAFDLRLALNRTAEGLQLQRIPIAIDSTPLRVKGLVGGSLSQSMRGAGVPGNLIGEYIKTMAYAVDLQRGVGKRDRFDIVVERDRAETGEVRYGQLLFAGVDRVGKEPIELGRYVYGGKPQFFRADGESAKKGLMRTPVEGARLTSAFGMRFHPLLAYSRMHQGVDFGARYGSPIYAAASGKVAYAAPHGGHGNYVRLLHNKELATAYAHMSKFAVRAGQSVSQGQIIGYVGSTGVSTGPHLHYEVWLRGKAVNPVQLKFIGGTQLAGNDMASFLSVMNRMRGLSVAGVAVAEAVMEPGRTRRKRG
ncbi:hypothetical protein GCM10011529_23040 [Polymorphobacter glacialis]|uniref:M23ase beta-sheet core domain-containing protein n=1 Tax=Sandarakinorhabdus glacialis TaxID=1614636 RepID=A0A916ZVJ3_9SPHN|nr:M23 family metallopeptidase [Polymorphobacter glacialis]GGE16030.1 hypothetical protein GCM10011529_23040 [Polymorphobacter glacialis]